MGKLTEIKKTIIEMIHKSGVSHIGSALSVVDILYVLYFNVANIDPKNPNKKDRDKIILSKGHASAALYSVLAHRGFFPLSYIDGYAINGGTLPCHIDMTTAPGLEASTGSLGHGSGIGVGMAIANKIDKNPSNVFVIVGDGECNEGSVWESIMLAATLKLDNFTIIVDSNKLQACGRTNEIICQKNLVEKFKAFGFESIEIDGHNLDEIKSALNQKTSSPKAIIANTIKGCGVSFMQDKLEWHYKCPNEEQTNQAISEIFGGAK